MLMPGKSSPLTLPATLPATLFAALPPGVRIPRIFMGWVPLAALYAKGVSSSSSSSSLGVASRCVSSSCPASSGYRPLSMNGRGVRGSSEDEWSSRWKAASDLTSSSSGFGSDRILRIRGCFSWMECVKLREKLGNTSRLTGKFRRRLKMVGISESMLAEDRRRGGVKGVLDGFGLEGVASSSLLSDLKGGV